MKHLFDTAKHILSRNPAVGYSLIGVRMYDVDQGWSAKASTFSDFGDVSTSEGYPTPEDAMEALISELEKRLPPTPAERYEEMLAVAANFAREHGLQL
jgi:hypothetical protein